MRLLRTKARLLRAFKLKNPRKGTEINTSNVLMAIERIFQIKESPEGDWNTYIYQEKEGRPNFQIKESPEGDWNFYLTTNQILKNTKLSN